MEMLPIQGEKSRIFPCYIAIHRLRHSSQLPFIPSFKPTLWERLFTSPFPHDAYELLPCLGLVASLCLDGSEYNLGIRPLQELHTEVAQLVVLPTCNYRGVAAEVAVARSFEEGRSAFFGHFVYLRGNAEERGVLLSAAINREA